MFRKRATYNEFIQSGYGKRGPPVGWTLDKALSRTTAKVYTNKLGKAVVVHRGTQPTNLYDWKNNAAYWTGGLPAYKKTNRYKRAARVQLAAENKYRRVATIGHSQGGLLAENVASKGPVVTFNKHTGLPGNRYQSPARSRQIDYRSVGGILGRDIASLNAPNSAFTHNVKTTHPYNPQTSHSDIEMMTGRGMYYTDSSGRTGLTKNSLISGSNYMPLSISSPANEHSDIVIAHEECIRDIYGSGENEEQIVVWNINPGLIQTFPFISKIAQNFELYVCEQVIFRYESVLSDRLIVSDGTQPQNGMIYGVPLDVEQRVPNTVGEIDRQDQANAVPFDTKYAQWGAEMDPAFKMNPNWKPVRSGGVEGNPVDQDAGRFALCVANTPSQYANKQIGKLKVYAKFRLYKIKPTRLFGPQLQCDRFLSSGSIVNPATATTPSACFGDGYNGVSGVPCIAQDNNIGCFVRNVQQYATGTETTGGPTLDKWTLASTGVPDNDGRTNLFATGNITDTLDYTNNANGVSGGSFILCRMPDGSEGCFKVTITSECQINNPWENGVSPPDATTTVMFTGGKVTPIFDLCVGGDLLDGTEISGAGSAKPLATTYVRHSMITRSGGNTAVIAANGTADTYQYTHCVKMMELHVRVLPSLDGTENLLIIPWADMGNATGTQDPQAWGKTEVEITEYKIQKDYKAPAYVTTSGDPAAYVDYSTSLSHSWANAQTINPVLQGNTIEVNPVHGRRDVSSDLQGNQDVIAT